MSTCKGKNAHPGDPNLCTVYIHASDFPQAETDPPLQAQVRSIIGLPADNGYNRLMVRQLEAVYEHGILRPLQPLSLEERQHVLVTITDLPSPQAGGARLAEQEWIRSHGELYAGQWVALDGSELISHGPRARAVRDEARAKGVEHPLLVRLPDEPQLPYAGWL